MLKWSGYDCGAIKYGTGTFICNITGSNRALFTHYCVVIVGKSVKRSMLQNDRVQRLNVH